MCISLLAEPLGLKTRHQYVPLSPGITEVIVSCEDSVIYSIIGKFDSFIWLELVVIVRIEKVCCLFLGHDPVKKPNPTIRLTDLHKGTGTVIFRQHEENYHSVIETYLLLC